MRSSNVDVRPLPRFADRTWPSRPCSRRSRTRHGCCRSGSKATFDAKWREGWSRDAARVGARQHPRRCLKELHAATANFVNAQHMSQVRLLWWSETAELKANAKSYTPWTTVFRPDRWPSVCVHTDRVSSHMAAAMLNACAHWSCTAIPGRRRLPCFAQAVRLTVVDRTSLSLLQSEVDAQLRDHTARRGQGHAEESLHRRRAGSTPRRNPCAPRAVAWRARGRAGRRRLATLQHTAVALCATHDLSFVPTALMHL